MPRKVTCPEVAEAAGLGEPKRNGAELLYKCPRHDDQHPSLSINPEKDVWLCGPCGKSGTAWQLAAFIAGIDPSDKSSIKDWLREHGLGKEELKVEHEYIYRDESGQPLFKSVRYRDPGSRRKTFRLFHLEKGQWKPRLNGARKVPYRLSDFLSRETVFVAEGEKVVDAMWNKNIPATTNVMGAGKWEPEYNQFFIGKTVGILPDNDHAGEEHAYSVASHLLLVAKAVRSIRLPGLPEKGDFADWGGTREEFRQIVQSTPDLTLETLEEWGARLKRESRPTDETSARTDRVNQILQEAGLESLAIENGLTQEAQEALRHLSNIMRANEVDGLTRSLVRSKVMKKLKDGKVSGVTELVDAAIGKNESNQEKQGQKIPFGLPEPWLDPVNGLDLFAEIKDYVKNYVVIPAGAVQAVSAWILATWAVAAFDISAYLVVRSPTRECGKSRLLEVLEKLVRKPFSTVNASEASLFRVLDKEEPTVIMDEAEALSGKSDRAESIRAILNAGHRRGVGVPRCEGEKNEVRWFKIFGFYAIAAIGDLWDTIRGRSIVIRMQRKSRLTRVERFRLRKAEREAQDIRRRIFRWIEDHLEEIKSARPELPDFLGDREQDVWECLLSVAQVIGDDTYTELVEAARALQPEESDEDNSPQIQLIKDLNGIFGTQERLFSETICEELRSMEDRRWPEYRNGKPITQNQLARLLKGFSRPDGLPVRPKGIRIGEERKKGYEKIWFTQLFDVYADTPPPNRDTRDNPVMTRVSGVFSNRDKGGSVTDGKSGSNQHEQGVVTGVTDEGGGIGEKKEKPTRKEKPWNPMDDLFGPPRT